MVGGVWQDAWSHHITRLNVQEPVVARDEDALAARVLVIESATSSPPARRHHAAEGRVLHR